MILFIGGGAPDFALILGGFLQIFGGGVFFWGGVFLGGVPPNFQGGLFGGGWFLQIFGGVSFFGGVLHRNTVNVRPVHILLECILVN